MTIAIGIIASDGIVMAADRQETFGYQKGSTGKITTAWNREPYGSFFVSGAGTGSYLDSVSRRLMEWFIADSKTADPKEIETKIEKMHCDFYRDKVIPFSKYPDHERPDYSLIMACAMNKRWPFIWTTEKLAFNKTELYDAVGIGAATAKAILSKLYVPLPVVMAINLAAYVMYEVKESVEGCGLGTDIYFTWQNTTQYVRHEEVFEMDRMFREYRSIERRVFHDCVNSKVSLEFRTPTKDKNKRRELRHFFSKLVDQRSRVLPQKVSSMFLNP